MVAGGFLAAGLAATFGVDLVVAGWLAADLVAALAVVFLAALPGALRPLVPLPVAAFAASSSTACSRVMVSAVLPSGREAFTLPCFT